MVKKRVSCGDKASNTERTWHSACLARVVAFPVIFQRIMYWTVFFASDSVEGNSVTGCYCHYAGLGHPFKAQRTSVCEKLISIAIDVCCFFWQCRVNTSLRSADDRKYRTSGLRRLSTLWHLLEFTDEDCFARDTWITISALFLSHELGC